ncbi:MAG TPA: T9SS type A sorting domain-containing protein [Flavipsychrobacter sp.]|nr:T9SS type A sorting domain-containing protein [Flavipsychrobacter sp.]
MYKSTLLKTALAVLCIFVMQYTGSAQTWLNSVKVAPATYGTTGAHVGKHTKMAVVNGNPALAYYDMTISTAASLIYVRASDANGTTWGTPIRLDNADAGYNLALTVVNGNPAIVYNKAGVGIRYIRATDASGTTWGSPITISANLAFDVMTMVIVNGNPAICYRNQSTGNLEYLRATDVNGATWGSVVTVASGNIGARSHMTVVNGNPAIVCYDNANNSVKYIRATDANGTTWGSAVTLNSGGAIVGQFSLAVVNGNPAVGFVGNVSGNGTLMYIRATDASGTTWGSAVSLETASNGYDISLAVVNGNPAMAYRNSSFVIRYRRATDVNGATWGSAITPGMNSVNTTLEPVTLTIVNGNPAIATFEGFNNNNNSQYIRAGNADGSAWNTVVSIDGGLGGNMQTTMAYIGGNPAMAYYSIGLGDLLYTRANDANGGSWGTEVSVATTNDVGQNPSLAQVNGNPAISYYDVTNQDLYYVRATNASGSTWGTPVAIATGTSAGRVSKLLVVSGNPAIAYTEGGSIKYIRATNASGTSWGSPITIATAGTTYDIDFAIVNGNPAVTYASGSTAYYCRGADATGSSFNTPVTIATLSFTDIFTPSLAVINGNPAVAYGDNSNMLYFMSELRYVRATDASGTTWGSTVLVEGSNKMLSPSLTTVNGNPAIAWSYNFHLLYYNRATNTTGSTWGTSVSLTTVRHDNLNDISPTMISNGNNVFIGYYTDTDNSAFFKQGTFDKVWTGGASTTNWATTTNWSDGAVPTSTSDILIPSGYSFYPVITTGTQNCKNLTVNAGGTLTISGGTLQVAGNISNSGTFNGTGGTVELNGSSAQSIAAGTLNISNLTLNNSTGATITSGTLNILGTYTPTSGVLTTGGFLTLKSTATGTGRIAAGSGAGGYISGIVNTERYIPGRRAFRFLSHPFITAQSMSDLTDDIDITGSGGSPFTTTGTNSPSAFYFDVTTGDNSTTGNNPGWTDFTASSTWDPLQVMRVLIRGAKGEGLGLGSYTPSNNTLDMSGYVNQGSMSVSLTKGSGTDFVLVGNPFPSQVNMDAVSGTNIGSSFYIWDANQGSRGAYTSYTFGSSSFNLPFGGAFVTTLSADGDIVFDEADKTSGTAGAPFKTTGIANQVELKLEDSTIFWDRLLLNFDDNAMATVDYPDAAKLYNPDMTFYTLSKDDSMLSIDTRPYVASETIKLGLYAGIKKKFKFTAPNVNMPAGTKLYFTDKLLSKTIEVTPSFEYWFTVDTSAASWGNNRFELNTQGEPTSIKNVNASKLKVKLVPNPATDNVTVYYEGAGKELNIIVTNMLGVKVSTATATNINGNITIPTAQLANGIYNVTICNGSEVMTQKLIKQ